MTVNTQHIITNVDLDARLKQKVDVTVETLAERNAIQVWRRRWAMVVAVYNDGVNNGFYYLEYGKASTNIGDNDNWDKFITGLDMSVIEDMILWEADGATTIRPKDSKTVDGSHLSGTVYGGLFQP